MKKARILALVLTLILIASIFAVYSFAAGDVTTRKSENYESVAAGTTGTASDGKNPTVGNTIFQIGGRLGKYEIIEENAFLDSSSQRHSYAFFISS